MNRFECYLDSGKFILRDNGKGVQLSIADPATEIFDGKNIAENINVFAESTVDTLYEESKLGILDGQMDFSNYSLIERAEIKNVIRNALQEKYLSEQSPKKSLSDVKKAVAQKKAEHSLDIKATVDDVLESDKLAYFLMSDGTFTTVHKAESLGEIDDVLGFAGSPLDDRCPDVKIALSYFSTDVFTTARNILISMTESKDFNYSFAEDVWKKIYTDDPSKLKNFDARNADAKKLQEEIENQACQRINELKALRNSYDGILREANVEDYFPDLYNQSFTLNYDFEGTYLDPDTHLTMYRGENDSYVLMTDSVIPNAYDQITEAAKQYEDYLDNNAIIMKNFSKEQETKMTYVHDIDSSKNLTDFVNETLSNGNHVKQFLGFYDDPKKAAKIARQYIDSDKTKIDIGRKA